jgi:hypothetical protein
MFLLRYVVLCAAQDGVEAAIMTLTPDQVVAGFVPTLPDGWNEGERGMFYCPKHTVVVSITVDGKAA